jgi:hypothetical protein
MTYAIYFVSCGIFCVLGKFSKTLLMLKFSEKLLGDLLTIVGKFHLNIARSANFKDCGMLNTALNVEKKHFYQYPKQGNN